MLQQIQRAAIKENISIIIKNSKLRQPDPLITKNSFHFVQDAIECLGLEECTKIVSEVYTEIEAENH
jgi:hypothetical protein